MNHDPLAHLLTHADRCADRGLGHSPGLAARVRLEARRRTRVKRTAAAATLLLLIAATTVGVLRPSAGSRDSKLAIVNPQSIYDYSEIARLKAEIAQLRRQAEIGETAVAMMMQAEQRGRQVPFRPMADPLQRIRDQQELAALALVRQAERQYRDLDRKPAAAATYERIVALFPQTAWANVARHRLLEIKG